MDLRNLLKSTMKNRHKNIGVNGQKHMRHETGKVRSMEEKSKRRAVILFLLHLSS